MLNRIRFAFAAGLFLTSSFAAKAEVLDAITDAPSSIFQFFRGVLASDAAKSNPVLVEVVEAPRAEAPARPRLTRRPERTITGAEPTMGTIWKSDISPIAD